MSAKKQAEITMAIIFLISFSTAMVISLAMLMAYFYVGVPVTAFFIYHYLRWKKTYKQECVELEQYIKTGPTGDYIVAHGSSHRQYDDDDYIDHGFHSNDLDEDINPATGLLMVGGLDVEGNLYGFSNDDDDWSSCSDDDWP